LKILLLIFLKDYPQRCQ